MDLALAQLALIFLPGLIWAMIDRTYGTGARSEQWQFFLNAFVFGTIAHTVLFFLYMLCDVEHSLAEIGTDDQPTFLVNFFDEIFFSLLAALALSVVWLYSVKYRIFMKLLHCLGATNRFGDEDVWTFTLNSSDPTVRFVHIRDTEKEIIISGWLDTYSEVEDRREVLIRDSVIYTDEGQEISRSPLSYHSFPKDSVWIEFPERMHNEQEN